MKHDMRPKKDADNSGILRLNLRFIPVSILLIILISNAFGQDKRLRDYGIKIGILQTGPYNAITDVSGVKVGHYTLMEGENIRTGVTAILPHDGNMYRLKVPAAVYIGNGYGKLAGYSQIKELGNIETPVVLTNTLSVPAGMNGLITYILNMPGNENVRSVNAVAGETNDGYLNDIRGRHITEEHVLQAIRNAVTGPVREGNVGAGTGTTCFGWKGGIGTASRLLPEQMGGYTVGVLVQTNFGGILEINGAPVGVELDKYIFKNQLQDRGDGSCMIVVATDAPLCSRNLERLAKRAMMGLAKTGGIASNGSGDYVVAFSAAHDNFIPLTSPEPLTEQKVLRNDEISALFLATIESTEEAIINSLFAAETMTGRDGHTVEALPVKEVLKILKKYNALK